VETDEKRQVREAVGRAVAVTGADEGLLLEPHGDGFRAVVVVEAEPGGRRRFAYSRKVARTVWETGTPTVWTGFPPDVDPGQSLPAIRMQSGMAVRLAFQSKPVGVLYVHAHRERREFGDTELRVFRALAALIGTALEARHLLDESSLRRRIEEQIALARQVQERFTPHETSMPASLDIAAHASVCLHLSGDYYDVIRRPDGRIALVIGDVSGKGIRTALYSSETRALVRRHMRDGDPPEVALTSVNRFLTEDMEPYDFMTLFIGLVDPTTREVVYASAAHNPPLLRRSDGELSELTRTGPALGWWTDAAFRVADPLRADPGDVLVLYTDGIYECHDARGEMYGEERLRASLDRHATTALRAEGIQRGLIADLDAFRGERPPDDDVTCVVLRFAGS
jgi:sigma-B regulation protein RsbU (phosphoserine phosphatase)